MTRLSKTLALFLICTLFLSVAALSQELPCEVGPRTIRAYSVANTNSICLVWPTNQYRLELRVARRVYTNRPTAWQNWVGIYAVTTSANQASQYCDTNVSSGIHYEYQISSFITNYVCSRYTTNQYWDYQYISTGAEVPLRDQRGNVILLVESSLAASLTTEITRLEEDLIGDGYRVFRHDVAASEVTAADWKTNVANTKALVRTDYNTDTNADWSIFIVGHVPIPYSGLSSPGSHTQNYGAHPADWYYADMDEGLWTDTTVSNSTATTIPPDTVVYSWNWNIPGDGKFDQSFIPSPAELRIGRVDLRNMPAFGKTEVQLMRQYLDRDHAWRHKQITTRDRGLIIPSGIPLENHNIYSSFFGSTTNTDLGLWLTYATNSANSYLFAASKGNGTFTRDIVLGSTTNFAATHLYAVFTTMHGSYYGHWDSAMHPNVVLLAPLAAEGYVLSTYYHEQMMSFDSSAMGEAIGYELYTMAANAFMPESTFFNIHKRYIQYGWIVNGNTYLYADRPNNYTTLMGDPTLRLRVVAPPTNVTVSIDGTDNVISWTSASDTNIHGYHLYRGPMTNQNGFMRITSTPVMTGSFRDVNAATVAYRYMVRTVKLEQTANRSYYNASQGIFAPLPPAGTSRLTATLSPVNGRTLLISGEPGRRYTVEYATNLSNVAAWYPLTNITLSAPTGAVSLANTNRLIFYRLKH